MDPTLIDGSREDAHNLDDLRDRQEERARLNKSALPTTPAMRKKWAQDREKEQERTRQ